MKTTKELMLDAIRGSSIPSDMIDGEYVYSCGNQWNEDFCWDMGKISKMSLDEIEKFYKEITAPKKPKKIDFDSMSNIKWEAKTGNEILDYFKTAFNKR